MVFRIEIQHDKQNGCIPACVRSVLKYRGIAPPPKAALIQQMVKHSVPGTSGFMRVQAALQNLGVSPALSIEVPNPGWIERVAALCRAGTPVLVPLSFSPKSAHCVVLSALDGTVATVHDPNDGSVAKVDIAAVKQRAADDIAFFP